MRAAKQAAEIRAKKPKEQFVRAPTEPTAQPPPTHVFLRGNHTRRASRCSRATWCSMLAEPVNFHADDPELPTTGRRLALAKQLTDGDHPLMARVLVNRFWMHHFGRGLVDTPGDFGLQGERPTHPELLDWLAGELVACGWSQKKLHRHIVCSAAYRQIVAPAIPKPRPSTPRTRCSGGRRSGGWKRKPSATRSWRPAVNCSADVWPAGAGRRRCEQPDCGGRRQGQPGRTSPQRLCAGPPQSAAVRAARVRRSADGAELRAAQCVHRRAAVAADDEQPVRRRSGAGDSPHACNRSLATMPDRRKSPPRTRSFWRPARHRPRSRADLRRLSPEQTEFDARHDCRSRQPTPPATALASLCQALFCVQSVPLRRLTELMPMLPIARDAFATRSALPAAGIFSARALESRFAGPGWHLLNQDGLLASPPPEKPPLERQHFDTRPKQPHHRPRATAMISLFMGGGPSHLDLFDPEAAAGQVRRQALSRPARSNTTTTAARSKVVMASPFKFAKRGQCGHRDVRADAAHGLHRRRHCLDPLDEPRRHPQPRRRHAGDGHRPRPGTAGPRWGAGSPTAWAARRRTCPAFVALVIRKDPPGSPFWTSGLLAVDLSGHACPRARAADHEPRPAART